MSKNLIRIGARARIAILASALAAATLPLSAQPVARPTAKPGAPLVVGFVYVTPVGDAGWTYQHDVGRRDLERALGPRVKTLAVESVPEGADAERVMRDLVAQGAGLVVATSFGYLEPALRVAADHPEVGFEHAGGYKTAPNLGTYDARYYEARWLGGYLAGRISRSGIAGYVAAFPVPEVVQGINAFALGMRAANPRAQVRVIWLDTWFDPARERAAAQSLVDRGADVLTNHSASPAVAQAAQANFAERGVRLVGYTSDMRAFAPDAQAAAIVHQWGGFYTQVATRVLEGRWSSEPVWGGLASGMVDLVGVDARLPASVRTDLAARRQAIASGAFKPFAGPLVDNTGRTRLASGVLEDAAIRSMDWLVSGVVGQVPAARR